MKKGTSGRVATNIDVSPEVLYDLVSDVRRMGEWSPECRRCEWIDGATGPAVGARFKGSNSHGLARWSTTTKIVAAESGREFAFVTTHLGRDMTRWSYRLEPASNGTVITESFEMLRDVLGTSCWAIASSWESKTGAPTSKRTWPRRCSD